MAKNPNKRWARCLYCDASILGDHATDAQLHDPYCPHGKALKVADDAKASAVLIDRARLDIAERLSIAEGKLVSEETEHHATKFRLEALQSSYDACTAKCIDLASRLSASANDLARVTALAEARGNEILRLAGERDGEAAARVSMECRLEAAINERESIGISLSACEKENAILLSRLDKCLAVMREALDLIGDDRPAGAMYTLEQELDRVVERQEIK